MWELPKPGGRMQELGLVRRADVQAQLGLGVQLIRKLIKEGHLKQVKVGRHHYVTQKSIDAYIESFID